MNPPGFSRWLAVIAGLLLGMPLRGEPIVVMDTHSLDVPRQDLETISKLFRQSLAVSSPDLLGPAELAHRARSSDVFKALLNTAEAAFQQGRKKHVELNLPDAISAYRDAISSYQRAAAGIYMPQPLSEAHLQLGIALAQSSRLSDALAELRQVITLTPWGELDPSVYNPTVRKLFSKERKEMERLPEVPADAVVLRALARLSGARLLVRPIADASGTSLVLHAAVIDLNQGKITGVESILIDRSLKDASGRLGELSEKLQLLLGAPLPEPARPESALPDPTITLAAGGHLGFGSYPRAGARALRVCFDLPIHGRFRISMGAGMRLDFADQISVPDLPEKAPLMGNWQADLTIVDVPVEVSSHVLLVPGDFEVYLEVGFVFGVMYLQADNASSMAREAIDFRTIKADTLGYGPGFKAGAGIRWRLSGSCSLVASASYHLSKLFYQEELHAQVLAPNPDPPYDLRWIDLHSPLRDILQGVDLSVGIALDL